MIVPVSGELPHKDPAFVKPLHALVDATRINSILSVNVPAVTLTANEVPVATKVYQTSG